MCAGLALAPALLVAAPSSATPPNLVIILADDLGYGDTGVTGQNARAALGLPAIATPNIDALAQAGVRFENMYAGGTNCSPSRTGLLTGFHQGHAMIDRVSSPPEVPLRIRAGNEDRTWGQMLQEAGVATGLFGKWHLGHVNASGAYSFAPTSKGFDAVYGLGNDYRSSTHFESDGTGGLRAVQVPSEPTWPGPGGKFVYGDHLVANRAEQFIRNKATGGQPFAALVGFLEPHTPHEQVPQNHPYVNMPWAKGLRDYAGLIDKLDRHVGQLLSALDDPNGDGNTSDSVASNTIVMFGSDNGPVWDGASNGFTYEFFDSNGPYAGHKWTTEEGGLRTPFFVRWGDAITPGTVNSSYVGSYTDILPTLGELYGQDVPLGIDGRSMLSELTGEGPSERPDVQVWHTEIGAFLLKRANVAVRVGDWKLYIRQPISNRTPPEPAVPDRLFNLANDPSEATNLLSSRPDIVAALQEIALAEGELLEPAGPRPGFPDPYFQIENTYFTQYKAWSPQPGSNNFFSAANWAGGTQYWQVNRPEAQNWNTSPADNWLATMANNQLSPQLVNVTSNASVLALELRGGAATMTLSIGAGLRLSARNGIRISTGGAIKLAGGELNTIREIDVRPGGLLQARGLITGQQHVIDRVPEFANLGLFEPQLVNRGTVSVLSPIDSFAGRLTILGDFAQYNEGELVIGLYSEGSVQGVDFDWLEVAGQAQIAGRLTISAQGSLELAVGHFFTLITTGRGLTGEFSDVIAPSLTPGLAWAMEYSSQSATLRVVEQAGSGGPNAVLSRWRQSFGVDAGGDLDGDGDSDGSDFLVWQRSIGSPGAAQPVAEPATIGLSEIGALAAFVAGARAKRRSTCLQRLPS